ncbi:MAG TPA: hypothetical protein VJY35_16305 [Candidatus Eisenbacteria bacterium]|nr:hypothetical protein [Candidatus Eisenbacteria bacterium]
MKRSRSTAPGSAAGGPARGRRITLILAGLAIVIAVVLAMRNRTPTSRLAALKPGADQVLLDSLEAADARHDWVRGLVVAERLAQLHPLDHGVLLARGTLWSNYAVDQRQGRVRPRPAMRTSLERMACMRRAIGLIDSSSISANTDQRWLDSGTRLARLYEALGLPGDALVAYETIKQRLPNEVAPAMRAYWMRALFYDPVHPDTSEWDRYQKRIGRR